jgi:hypothetical protein
VGPSPGWLDARQRIPPEPGRKGASPMDHSPECSHGGSTERVRSVGTRVEGTWQGPRGYLRGESGGAGLGCSVKSVGASCPRTDQGNDNGYREHLFGGTSPECGASENVSRQQPSLRGKLPIHASREWGQELSVVPAGRAVLQKSAGCIRFGDSVDCSSAFEPSFDAC